AARRFALLAPPVVETNRERRRRNGKRDRAVADPLELDRRSRLDVSPNEGRRRVVLEIERVLEALGELEPRLLVEIPRLGAEHPVLGAGREARGPWLVFGPVDAVGGVLDLRQRNALGARRVESPAHADRV